MTCCSSLIAGPTKPSSTRPKARSISIRRSSSWPGRPSPVTGRSTCFGPARSASSRLIRMRRSPRKPRPGWMPMKKAWSSLSLNHEFTRVMSPIDGQISYYRKTLGNLVTQNQTRLTTIVSVDPIYVHFEMDEPTLLRHRTALNEGKLRLPKDRTKIPVLLGLQGEEGYPHPGTINFVDNQVNRDDGQHPGAGCLCQPHAPERPPA